MFRIMKTFNGKAIYNPSGKAGEYAEWACNFYVGCSNGCEYCYLKKGVLAKTMGGNKPTLKKCFRDEEHAFEVFEKELIQNLSELEKHGLFFSFTTDPMIEETIWMTLKAIEMANSKGVPVKILTKSATWVDTFILNSNNYEDENGGGQTWRTQYAFGFTLTGHDELEPNASTNAERIDAMKKLHEAGFKTFASIEPIVDFESSKQMINLALPHCDLFKVGLMSGKKYNVIDAQNFVEWISEQYGKFYIKENLQKLSHYSNSDFDNCVTSNYNLFEQ